MGEDNRHELESTMDELSQYLWQTLILSSTRCKRIGILWIAPVNILQNALHFRILYIRPEKSCAPYQLGHSAVCQ